MIIDNMNHKNTLLYVLSNAKINDCAPDQAILISQNIKELLEIVQNAEVTDNSGNVNQSAMPASNKSTKNTKEQKKKAGAYGN